MNHSKAVPSNCVKICKLENNFCVGCHRSLSEIGAWASATDDERRAILRRCEIRAQKSS